MRDYFNENDDENDDEDDDRENGIELQEKSPKLEQELFGRSSVHEEKDVSVSDYESASEMVEKLKQVRALLEHARVLEKLGDIAAANSVYEKSLGLVF